MQEGKQDSRFQKFLETFPPSVRHCLQNILHIGGMLAAGGLSTAAPGDDGDRNSLPGPPTGKTAFSRSGGVWVGVPPMSQANFLSKSDIAQTTQPSP